MQALDEVNPHLFTIATLTGHAVIAVGPEYTVYLHPFPLLFEMSDVYGANQL